MSQTTERTRKPWWSDRITRFLMVVAALLGLAAVALAAGLGGGQGDKSKATPPAAARIAPTPLPTPVPVTPAPCIPPYDWGIHVVKEGDTLYGLAERYGTDIESIQRVNCLSGHLILIDQDLYVPGLRAGGPPPAVAAAGAATTRISSADRYVNVILLGSDRRTGSSVWRTDTMILVSVDTELAVVRLLSIPRDLWVDIPGHGYDRINTADLWGELAEPGRGPELVKQTLYDVLGIPIAYFVRADFYGFIKIIDALGGVDVDVECALPDIKLLPGVQHMDGDTALLYARSRITTNDFDRSRRQRKLLMALWAKARSTNVLPRLPALWVAMRGTFDTDMPLDQVLGMVPLGFQIKFNHIFSQSIGPWQVENYVTPGGAQVLLPNHEEIKKLLDAFYGPIDLELLAKIGETRIEVLNGSWRNQADRLAAAALGWMGFQVVRTGQADSLDYAHSQVIVYTAEPVIAELAAQELDLPRSSMQYQLDRPSSVDIRIILGADYDPCMAR